MKLLDRTGKEILFEVSLIAEKKHFSIRRSISGVVDSSDSSGTPKVSTEDEIAIGNQRINSDNWN